MTRRALHLAAVPCALALLALAASIPPAFGADPATDEGSEPPPPAEEPAGEGLVHCANLIYAADKTSVCFSDAFLTEISRQTSIRTTRRFEPVRMDTDDLFLYPFCVMTGEGDFALTDPERANLRDYLHGGGFVIASAGCSSSKWNTAFQREITALFPDTPLEELAPDHPIYHTVYDITSSKYKSGDNRLPLLKGLTLEGRTVLVWSPDGLNDTANAGPDCCCCGGNEIKSAKLVNVNILAYALTH